jgi:hypothetical protein
MSIGPEYFEDETGIPVTKYEMIQHVSGDATPVIVADHQSITRLGPSPPTNTHTWSSDRANTIAQFIDVVQRIAGSRWMKSPPSITTVSGDSTVKEVLEASFASDEETMSILAYFRQLHAKDRLLAKSVDAYTANCGDPRKIDWVSKRKQAFEAVVDSPPTPYETDGKTRREILRMFMYGAGLLHSPSSDADHRALRALVARMGKHEAVMVFHSCLMDLLGIAVDVYHVIRMDFHYWVTDCGLDPPTRFQIRELFASHRESR